MRIAGKSILLIAAVTLLAVLPNHAAERKEFSGTEAKQNGYSNHTNIFAADGKAFNGTETFYMPVDPGTVRVLPNGNTHVRNQVAIYSYTATDSRIAGYLMVGFNGNFDSAFSGPMWGTFYSVDENGNRVADGWEGTWSGRIFSVAPAYNWIAKSVGRGTGAYKGLKLETTTAYGDSFVGVIVGVIKDSHKK